MSNGCAPDGLPCGVHTIKRVAPVYLRNIAKLQWMVVIIYNVRVLKQVFLVGTEKKSQNVLSVQK